MRMNVFRILSIFFAVVSTLLSLTGCDKHTVYHSYQHISSQGWNNRDTLIFIIDTIQENATYNFSLELRSTGLYPYQNIWLAIERRFYPDILCYDTVECHLTTPTTLRNGKGIYMYQHKTPLSSMQLRNRQTGQVSVIHLMQKEVIVGIHDIGLLVCRSDSTMFSQIAPSIDTKKDKKKDRESPQG